MQRREFTKAGAAALTASILTGQLPGANDRIQVGFIGLGRMGTGNLEFAMKTSGMQPVALCDVYRPNLDQALAVARKGGHSPKLVHDFREILADRSIDAVCISTPDHWHAYMTVEACKAGKDVYVEKPACKYVGEGPLMVQAARKYNRVVQAGTMQRSGAQFRTAAEIVRSGQLGEIRFCRNWEVQLTPKAGSGKPADCAPPHGLDWDLWLGPAPAHAFNPNRFGVLPDHWSTFRYFWDYAGGEMTDMGVHMIDIQQFALNEIMPAAIDAMGGRFYVQDNLETPDTMVATFRYPEFVSEFESEEGNPLPMYGRDWGSRKPGVTMARDYGTAFHGSRGSLIVNRDGYEVMPVEGSGLQPRMDASRAPMNAPHWADFADCIRTRRKPVSDIETCVRSTTICLLANVALRSGLRLDWDESNWTVRQDAAIPFLEPNYRSPWKLTI